MEADFVSIKSTFPAYAAIIKATDVFTISNAHGAVTYKKTGGAENLTIGKKGQIKVKKGTKKGTYGMTVAVTASGDANCAAGSVTVEVVVRVK